MDSVKVGKINIPIIKGEKGDTPIKGVDYWTESDKQEIIDETESKYNENHTEKINEYNTNSTDKSESFNTLADEKINQLSKESTDLISALNSNAERKEEEINNLATEKKEEIESINNTLYPLVQNAQNTADRAETIARGSSRTKVFNTISEMEAWIIEHKNELNIGDNLYIRAIDVPDYWWDGNSVQELETEKVDLTEYAKKEQIPTKTSELINDSGYLKQHQDISGKEEKSNKVTSISNTSTDMQYPSAKAVYNYIDSLNAEEVSY